MSHIEEEVLYAYLDGECDEDERQEVERHVATCDDCRERMREAKGLGLEAAELLAELEPGPVHAPPWHELERRAADRKADRDISADAGDLAAPDTVGAGMPPVPLPLWRRPALAWAATIVLAFGLGWLTNSGLVSELLQPAPVGFEEIEDPTELSEANPFEPGRVESSAGEVSFEEIPEEELRFASQPQAAPAAEPDARDADAQAVTDEVLVAGERAPGEARQDRTADELKALAEGMARKEAAPATPAAAEPPPAVADPKVAEQEQQRATMEDPVARRQRQVVAADERRAAEIAQANVPQQRMAAVAAADAPPVAVAGVVADLEGGAGADLAAVYHGLVDRYSAAGRGGEVGAVGFYSVSPESAEAWLGAPLRQLPELTLVGVEVGPGGSLQGSLRGLPLVILQYQDAAGQQVTLLQQYLVPAAPEGPEAVTVPRSEAVAEPALIVSPGGVRAYRWQDASGYLLTIVGTLSSDTMRGLADRVR